MVNIQAQISAIRAAWVSRIASAPENHMWAYLPKLYLSKFGNDYLVLRMSFTDIRKFPWVKQIPLFYQDIIISYNRSKIIQYDDFCQNITNQPLHWIKSP